MGVLSKGHVGGFGKAERQEAHMVCPQGVRSVLTSAEKHMAHVQANFADSRAPFRAADSFRSLLTSPARVFSEARKLMSSSRCWEVAVLRLGNPRRVCRDFSAESVSAAEVM